MNQQFSFKNSEINDVKIIEPFLTEDIRGFFSKTYEKDIFKQNGIDLEIQESFETFSQRGVIRGMHFQTLNPQSKLIQVFAGEIYDVAVDLRTNSNTFGKWVGEYLNSENHKMFFIPQGFAHGFLVLSETAMVSYKCGGKFLSEFDTGIIWNDRDIDIKWPLHLIENIIISDKDKNLQNFEGFKNAK